MSSLDNKQLWLRTLIRIQEPWIMTQSPPKSNRLILGPRPAPSKTFVRICSELAKCHALSANCKESGEMIYDPGSTKESVLPPTSNRFLPAPRPTSISIKISSNFVHNVCRYFVYKNWLQTWTDGQTHISENIISRAAANFSRVKRG